MVMLTEDIEGIAGELLRWAGADDSAPTKPVALTKALLGPGALFSVHARSLPGDGSFAVVNGEPRIYIRQGISPQRRRWAICHELAEWWLWKEDVRDSQIENFADAIAAALIVPGPAFRTAVREVGDQYHRLAAYFGTSESCVALRTGEVTGAPLALISPERVRVRGDLFYWGTERQVRALEHKPLIPGMRRAKLRDDRRRTAIKGLGLLSA